MHAPAQVLAAVARRFLPAEEALLALPRRLAAAAADAVPAAVRFAQSLGWTDVLLAVLVALFALAGLFVLPLFSRIDRRNVLDSEARRAVWEQVHAEPGAHASRIAQALGLDRKTVAHHLAHLRRLRLVELEREGRLGRWHPPGRRPSRPLAEGVAADILRAALAEPGLSQSRLAERLGVCRATVQWHARRLVERGLLEPGALRVRRGRETEIRGALLGPLSF